MKKNLQTEAGQTDSPNAKASSKAEKIDAINQCFALFKRNYHNQFFKAFANEEDVIAVKRLWLESLSQYSATEMMHAAHAIVKSSEFLPTLKTMIDACERSAQQQLPSVHSAYAEACNASSPKQAYAWSHPAVYHAGRKVGWHFLHSHSENVAYPVFKEAYLAISRAVREGEKLDMPKLEQITHKKYEAAEAKVGEKYINSLKSLLDD